MHAGFSSASAPPQPCTVHPEIELDCRVCRRSDVHRALDDSLVRRAMQEREIFIEHLNRVWMGVLLSLSCLNIDYYFYVCIARAFSEIHL